MQSMQIPARTRVIIILFLLKQHIFSGMLSGNWAEYENPDTSIANGMATGRRIGWQKDRYGGNIRRLVYLCTAIWSYREVGN